LSHDPRHHPYCCAGVLRHGLVILWGSKSIPRAIVFVVVFPVLLVITLTALMAFSQNADSGRLQHVERAKR
jgi:hypothetical protein